MEALNTKYKCWCGAELTTDGKRKWCSTREDKTAHEKHDYAGKKEPLRVDNHTTLARPRKG